MSDLGTNVERVDRRYLWRASKRGQRVHIEDTATGRAYCQVENCGGKPFDGRGAEIPAGRRVCQNCADLAGRSETDYRELDIRVLLGERMAEVEPMLFASTVAPERTDLTLVHRGPKLKRAKQTRRVNRSRGRKPRRSNVKHTKPFDDPLPW